MTSCIVALSMVFFQDAPLFGEHLRVCNQIFSYSQYVEYINTHRQSSVVPTVTVSKSGDVQIKLSGDSGVLFEKSLPIFEELNLKQDLLDVSKKIKPMEAIVFSQLTVRVQKHIQSILGKNSPKMKATPESKFILSPTFDVRFRSKNFYTGVGLTTVTRSQQSKNNPSSSHDPFISAIGNATLVKLAEKDTSPEPSVKFMVMNFGPPVKKSREANILGQAYSMLENFLELENAKLDREIEKIFTSQFPSRVELDYRNYKTVDELLAAHPENREQINFYFERFTRNPSISEEEKRREISSASISTEFSFQLFGLLPSGQTMPIPLTDR